MSDGCQDCEYRVPKVGDCFLDSGNTLVLVVGGSPYTSELVVMWKNTYDDGRRGVWTYTSWVPVVKKHIVAPTCTKEYERV